MKCLQCKKNFEEGYCKECFLEIQGLLLQKAMEGTMQAQVSNLQTRIWGLEDEISELTRIFKLVLEEIKDFKIRGLKLKSIKEK